MTRPAVIVFASGTKDGGGSGFENLVRSSELDADIVAVVSQHEHGGVRERADRLRVPFIYFPGQYSVEEYQRVVEESGAEWVALSGWIKLVQGLDPRKTFNIHPALLSQLGGRFGGKGMFNNQEHIAVKQAFDAGEIKESGVTMHFVTDAYDRGPAFFEYPVALTSGMSSEDIRTAVSVAEHEWQPRITNMVIHGQILWDGTDPATLKYPAGYPYFPKG